MEAGTDIKSDRVGIASALLCTVHCLVVPVLYVVKFSWGHDHVHALPAWWELLDYVFLVISFMAVYHSAGHTASRTIRRSLWLFWLMLAAAILLSDSLHWLAYLASAGLVGTHFLNIRRMHRAAKTAAKI